MMRTAHPFMFANFMFANKSLDLSQIQVMGVLNVTPDSFSDGGQFASPEAALKRAELMMADGASIIDIGGESTRPGAQPISVQQELDRVCPIVERLALHQGVIISVDTSQAQVMTEVIKLGAGMINDVRAFSSDGALAAVSASSVALCVMHMQGCPEFMQTSPHYQSVVDEVARFLIERVEVMEAHGIAKSRIIVDPGFGFGKTLEHNLVLLNNIGQICGLGYPVLVGLSRKSMLGTILDKPVNQRLYGSLAAATIAARQGARIVRVHDVRETKEAMLVVDAINRLASEAN